MYLSRSSALSVYQSIPSSLIESHKPLLLDVEIMSKTSSTENAVTVAELSPIDVEIQESKPKGRWIDRLWGGNSDLNKVERKYVRKVDTWLLYAVFAPNRNERRLIV